MDDDGDDDHVACLIVVYSKGCLDSDSTAFSCFLVFSMSVFPGLAEDFCTCGEDGTVRVWKGKGSHVCPVVSI